MTRAADPFDRLRRELGQAAMRQSPDSRRSESRLLWFARRPLAAVGVALLVTGTATAAVLSGKDSTNELTAVARFDSTAAQNLAPLNRMLDITPSRIPTGPARSGAAGVSAPVASGGVVRGATITHGQVTVDVSVTDTRICLAPTSTLEPPSRSSSAQSEGRATDWTQGCAALPVSSQRLSFVQGGDASQSWIVAIAPDGVSMVGVTDDTGASTPAFVNSNIAIVSVPEGRTFRELKWQRPDGTPGSLVIGDAPSNATEATVTPLPPVAGEEKPR